MAFHTVTARKLDIPISEKFALSLDEAAALSSVSPNLFLNFMPESRYIGERRIWLKEDIEKKLRALPVRGANPLLPIQPEPIQLPEAKPRAKSFDEIADERKAAKIR